MRIILVLMFVMLLSCSGDDGEDERRSCQVTCSDFVNVSLKTKAECTEIAVNYGDSCTVEWNTPDGTWLELPEQPPAPEPDRDTTPPSIPGNLTVNFIASNQVDLAWTASTDDRGGTINYTITRNNQIVGSTVDETFFFDMNGLEMLKEFCYRIKARDQAQNGSSSEEVCITTPGNSHFKWSYPVAGHSLLVASTLDETSGTIYLLTYFKILTALDLSGAEMWSVDLNTVTASSLVDNSESLMIGNDGNLYLFYTDAVYIHDPTNGNELWHYTWQEASSSFHALNPDGSENWNYQNVTSLITVLADGSIYLVSNASLVAVNPDGSEKWSHPININVKPTILVDGSAFVVLDGEFIALNADGSERWISNEILTANYLSQPVKVVADTVMVFADQKYVLDKNTGELLLYWPASLDLELEAIDNEGTYYYRGSRFVSATKMVNGINTSWKYYFAGHDFGAMEIGPDFTVYAAPVFGNKLYAIDPLGELKWSYTAFNESLLSDGIQDLQFLKIVDNKLYAGMRETFLALNFDGSLAWSFSGSWRNIMPVEPLIGSDGTIYIAIGATFFALTP